MEMPNESWIHDPKLDDDEVVKRAIAEPQYARLVVQGRLLSDGHRAMLEGVISGWEAAGNESLKALPEITPPAPVRGETQARPRWGLAIGIGSVIALLGMSLGVTLAFLSLPPSPTSGGGVPSAQSDTSASRSLGVLRAGSSSFVCQTNSERSRVQCWGALGDSELQPRVVENTFTSPISILTVGKGYASVVDTSGTVWSFGESTDGQLGAVHASPQWNANTVGTLPTPHVEGVAQGVAHACFLSNGDVWCYGSNKYGQIRGVATPEPSQLVKISLPVNAVSIGSSGYETWATGVDGKVYGWGANNRGALTPLDSAASLPPSLLKDPWTVQSPAPADRPQSTPPQSGGQQ